MSVHRTNKGKWEVRWREGSKNRSRTFDLKGDAESFDRKVRRQSQAGEPVPARTGTDTLAEFFTRWLAGKRHSLAPRTFDFYRYLFGAHVAEQIGYAPLRSLTPDRMEEWQRERLEKGAGRVAIGQTQQMLSQVFKRAIRQGRMESNPLEGLDKPRTERERLNPMSVENVERLRAYFIDNDRLGDAVLIQLQAYGGMRFGEALAVHWEDFSLSSRFWVHHGIENDGSLKGTKNGKEGFAYLPSPAVEDVMLWRRETRPSGLVIYRAKDGKGWKKSDRGNWRTKQFVPALKALNIPRVPIKNLRHTAASLRIASGKRSTEVAEELRHSLAVSIDRYQRLMREMEGQPVRPMDEVIQEAREKVTSEFKSGRMATPRKAPAPLATDTGASQEESDSP